VRTLIARAVRPLFVGTAGRCGILLALVLLDIEPAARGELPPLIPRKVLFGGPRRSAPRLSPDGTRLAYLAPSAKGVSNIWVQTLGKDDAQQVTQDTHRGVREFFWAADHRHLIYRQDRDGDENWHIYATDLETKLVRDLTPFQGIRTQDLMVSGKRPNEILVGLNVRDRKVFDIYRVDLNTGAVILDTQNPGDVLSWVTDENFVIRAATAFGGENAQTTIRVRDDAKSPWRDLMVIPFEDCSFNGQVNGGSMVAGFGPEGKTLYVDSPLGSDKTRLVEIDVASGKELRVLAADPRCDVDYDTNLILFAPVVEHDPATGRIQAAAFDYTKRAWKVIDPAIQKDFEVLQRVHHGTLAIVDRVKDDTLWLVSYSAPDSRQAYYLYDRTQKKAEVLLADRSDLGKYTLAQCEPVVIKSRDGLDLVCYLTVPPGVERKHLPFILLPHGGPWWRDRWGFDAWVQMLANRGYAVLQVNYRASTGFGKAFFNAGNQQFGDQGIMRDLLDSVQWAIDSGLADPNRLAVMGGSGGGYHTLCCIAFHPEMWKCAVDLVGPSSVRTLLQSVPAYWKPVKQRWVRRFGDAEHDEELNQRISPLYHAGNIRAPLLMGYGLNDPRVNIAEAHQMAKAMRDKNLPVMLVVYPDEGHSFARPENNDDFFGRMEEFLAQHLGGRKEPWHKLPGSSAELH
jgi:dipeptidyl aminopeptidase/acylaminoacyl peptidase